MSMRSACSSSCCSYKALPFLQIVGALWLVLCETTHLRLCQYQGRMYNMWGNADGAWSLFLESISCWCSVLARRQWVMLKPMNVNCQTQHGAKEPRISRRYCLVVLKPFISPSSYNMLLWLVNIRLTDSVAAFDLWCFAMMWLWVRAKLFGFIWLSASQISWSSMLAKHLIHPLSHQAVASWGILAAHQWSVWRNVHTASGRSEAADVFFNVNEIHSIDKHMLIECCCFFKYIFQMQFDLQIWNLCV